MSEKANDYSYTGLEIAVIGMSCKTPKANSIHEYWDILKNGRETISLISDDELLKNGVDRKLLEHPHYVKTGNYLDDKDCFDSTFFDYLPNEAKVMDPQMRIFHEIVWESLEDAGYNPDDYKGLIGLFAGAGANYNWQSIAMIENENSHVDNFSAQQLNNKDFMTTRISYKLNLNGPSVFIQTACSTSLVAVHMACRSILMGECSIAVAGGITVLSTPKTGYLYSEGMVLSPDGHCKAFDADAQGTVFSEGAGAVVLKRLKNAIADGDNIHAIIKGSAINNDGSRKVGYTAPSIEGQVEVLRLAQKTAKVNSKTISYIEAHGTGTSLGDPIEVEALNIAFGKSDEKYCGVGSVKSNIGHLDTAAGVISLIKTILSLKNRMLPPSINFNKLNPKINFSDSPFYINTSLKKWGAKNDVLRAGVSSLGIGGTNAHVIVEEAPKIISQESSRNCQIMLLSARTVESIKKTTINIADYLKHNNEVNLADIAYTLQKGRKHFMYRKYIVCNNYEDAINSLENISDKYSIADVKNKSVVFLFTGQGSQYADMGRSLYQTEAMFEEEVDNCFDIVYKLPGITRDESLSAEENVYNVLNHPNHTQIALFSFEYSLAKYLCRIGIKPDIVLGHSLGEYVAACISGVFTLEEAINLIAAREKIMNTLPKGSMLSVSLSEHEISNIIEKYGVSLASVNGPKSCVISGNSQMIEKAEAELLEKEVVCQKLHTLHAYHSKDIDEIVEAFRQELSNITFRSPQIPILSNFTGDFISENKINVEYWCKHLRNTVRFSDGVNSILKKSNSVFIEVGPGRTLSSLVRQHISNEQENQKRQLIVNIIRHPKEDVCDQCYLMNRIGELWSYGLKIDWDTFNHNEKRTRISLPTYPFEKTRYPAVGDPFKILSERMAIHTPGKKPNVSDWFYMPSWISKPLISKMEETTNMINLVLGEDTELNHSIAARFIKNGEKTIKVFMGDQFKKISKHHYIIDMTDFEQYNKLVVSLKDSGMIPNRIIHLMNVREGSWTPTLNILQNRINKGLYSFLNMVKAMGKQNILSGTKIIAITNEVYKVLGSEQISPEKSLIIGLLKVLPQEYPSVKSLNIDISLTDDKKVITNNIFDELSCNSYEKTVSYRGQMRWVQQYIPFKSEYIERRGRIKDKGIYLVIGGLGKLGMEICKHLITKYKSNVMIFGRTDFTQNIENDDNYILKKNRLTELKDLAKDNVAYFNGDITRHQDINNCISIIEKSYGSLDGVIYAAGVVDGKSINTIESLTDSEFEEQFNSKLHGLLALKKALGKRKPDFCVIVSSLSSILGGLRYSAYAAANTFIDSYIQNIDNKKWIAVDLDGLNFEPVTEIESRSKNYFIDKSEAVDIFDRIINHIEIPQVIISTGDLQERIDKWINQTEEQNQPVENLQGVTRERPQMTSAYKAPDNDTQKKLAEIWNEFFGINNVGIEDNFFELGGDSLKAVTISKKIYKELNVEITLAEFFNNVNIKELSACIEGKSISNINETVTDEAVVLFDEWDQKIVDNLKASDPNIHEIYPLTYMQLSALNYNIMYSNTEYTTQIVTCLLENLNTIKFKNAWKKVIEMHSILRSDFIWRKKLHAPVQIIHKDTPLLFNEIDLRGMTKVQQDQRTKEYVDEIKMNKFRKAPLMNVTLIRLNDGQHRLIWCYQNMLFDGWSAEIILNNLIAIYKNKIGKSKIPVKTSHSFLKYIDWLNSKNKKDAESFWKKEFEGFDCLSLSNEKNESMGKERKLLMCNLKLTENEKKAIKDYAVKNNLSLYTLIVSCWSLIQSSTENKKDIIIGTMTSGRPLTLEGIDTMVGLFTNVIPIRVTVPETSISKKWFTYMQNKLLNCKEFEYVSLPQIANWCSIPYDVLRKSIYDKTVVYVDYPTDETIQVEGIDDHSSQGGLLLPMRIITGPELDFCIKYDKDKHSETEIMKLLYDMKEMLVGL